MIGCSIVSSRQVETVVIKGGTEMAQYACIFPGQGSQQVGMGKELCRHWQIAQETFMEASDVLHFDLGKLCFIGPQHLLTATEFAQPAILTTSVATLRVLQQLGVEPMMVAGHSVGSFASLVAARSLPFAQAVFLVRQRGLFMAAVRRAGTMLAVVSVQPERLAKIEAEVRENLTLDIASYNSPTQMVFSGEETEIHSLQERLASESGLQAKRFSVSHAFHSRLMSEKKMEWADYLQGCQLHDACIPVGLNVTGTFTTEAQLIRNDLIEQFTQAVQWRKLYGYLLAQPHGGIIEVGMGRTLSAIARAWRSETGVATTESAAAIMRLSKTLQTASAA